MGLMDRLRGGSGGGGKQNPQGRTAGGGGSSTSTGGRFALSGLAALLVVVMVAVTGLIIAAVKILYGSAFQPEIVLSIILVVGVIGLLSALAMLVGAFYRFGRLSSTSALGLPDGSIQAVIALALILIFAIVGVYLHATSGTDGPTRELRALSSAQVDALPAGSIVSVSPPRTVDGEQVFDVRQAIDDPQRETITTQLLTTISTLVVAVAGFYFGAKTAQGGTARDFMGGAGVGAALPRDGGEGGGSSTVATTAPTAGSPSGAGGGAGPPETVAPSPSRGGAAS